MKANSCKILLNILFKSSPDSLSSQQFCYDIAKIFKDLTTSKEFHYEYFICEQKKLQRERHLFILSQIPWQFALIYYWESIKRENI